MSPHSNPNFASRSGGWHCNHSTRLSASGGIAALAIFDSMAGSVSAVAIGRAATGAGLLLEDGEAKGLFTGINQGGQGVDGRRACSNKDNSRFHPAIMVRVAGRSLPLAVNHPD